ncbi:Retrovirus-related Pol polyprotein from transposon RE2 [Linum grandiflorum]
MVAEDEQQREISGSSKSSYEATVLQTTTPQVGSDAAAFQVKGRNSDSRPDKSKVRCPVCRRTGHPREECFVVIGYPDWWKGRIVTASDSTSRPTCAAQVVTTDVVPQLNGITSDQLAKLLALIGDSSPSNADNATTSGNSKPLSWIFYSGCTDHITCDHTRLHDLQPAKGHPPVKIPDGSSVPINGIGSVGLGSNILLSRVLHVPEFKCNLISISKLTNARNCAVTFFPDRFVIQDLQTGTLIGKGKLRDGLYYWDEDVSRLDSMALATQQSGTPYDVWHQRLGHPSFEKLHTLFIRDSIDSCNKVDHCDVCVRAKQTRLPFQSSSIKTNDCFELLHCDIWGPYQTPSLTGARYFLTIVDDYSRAVWVYLLKHKSEVGSILPTFCTMIRTQFGYAVRRIRADNGLEFQSQHIRKYYDAHGIILETSCTDTP